eukprot:CAMPEP_0204615172 /NCGR_PEP_ID=MMETSP0717-20131115/2731_1 /ASSEMBLY_ACC=CAM_ASM_000666 /TAXON_ID=230516 /ORGANISM="Chaetoceros curvisetus" /LENGTH=216 /DNA_ID=CAMNT_0051628039 /DNA_START=276 /DNA_END=926 /DNA_ORIENTATION=-
MIGNFLSGVTGQPPSSLNPPLELLSNTNIDPNKSNVDLVCVYKASRDGWSAIDFHESCDGRGSGLVVALTSSGKKFGGYNPIGWQSTDDYGSSNSAFLWFENKTGTKAEICPVLSGGNAAIFDYATGGPQFGSADLIIGPPKAAVLGGFAGPDMEDTSANAGSLKSGTSTFGGAYEDVKGWPRGSHRFVEIEVYMNGNVTPSSFGVSSGKSIFWPF